MQCVARTERARISPCQTQCAGVEVEAHMGARYQSESHPGSFGSARRTLGTLPSSLQCLLSAAPPPSPKSHSTCSGSFVVGVLINFILINSVISSCLQNRHQALLGDGSAEGAADTGFISPWALYISYGSERVGLGGKQKTPPACSLSMSFAKCPLFARPKLVDGDCLQADRICTERESLLRVYSWPTLRDPSWLCLVGP